MDGQTSVGQTHLNGQNVQPCVRVCWVDQRTHPQKEFLWGLGKKDRSLPGRSFPHSDQVELAPLENHQLSALTLDQILADARNAGDKNVRPQKNIDRSANRKILDLDARSLPPHKMIDSHSL